jgi:hypothetical protein
MERNLSPEARARMGEAGSKNLVGWRSRARTRAQELEAEVNAYRDSLLRDVGANPTATRIGLVEAAVLTFAGILKLRHSVINSSKSDVVPLTERASWLGSNLCRLLKSLNLDARPRPRTLAEVFQRKVEQEGSNQGQKPADLKESAPKGSES